MTKFIFPTKEKFPISSKFGKRIDPFTGEEKFHIGIDIVCPENTPICAVCDGRVIKIWEDELNGRAMRYMSNDGEWVIGISHLNGVIVTLGEMVVQGEEIALSGNTGHSKGAHLHTTFWRVILKATDPETLLPKDEELSV